jgi:GT2 family glycosyltransferase
MVPSNGTTSIIVSAYERPRHLWFTLLALLRQSARFDEVIVADDGSGEEVRSVIEKFAPLCDATLLHVWQKHGDYRLARSRNNAIRAASGEHLIFLDQDCVPWSHFVSAHASFRQPGVFKVGACVHLDRDRANRLQEEDITSGEFESLLNKEELRKLRKAQRKDDFYAFFRKHAWPIKFKPKLRGGNFSIHKADLLKVNGFDENYVGWGQEDDDLGRRLYLAGMTARSVVASAITFHLHHPLPADATPRWHEGRNVLYYLRRKVPPFAENGLQKKDGEQPEDVKISVYR